MLAMPGAVNEMDSSNEGAADLTIIVRSAAKKIKKIYVDIYFKIILKPSFLPGKTLD